MEKHEEFDKKGNTRKIFTTMMISLALLAIVSILKDAKNSNKGDEKNPYIEARIPTTSSGGLKRFEGGSISSVNDVEFEQKEITLDGNRILYYVGKSETATDHTWIQIAQTSGDEVLNPRITACNVFLHDPKSELGQLYVSMFRTHFKGDFYDKASAFLFQFYSHYYPGWGRDSGTNRVFFNQQALNDLDRIIRLSRQNNRIQIENVRGEVVDLVLPDDDYVFIPRYAEETSDKKDQGLEKYINGTLSDYYQDNVFKNVRDLVPGSLFSARTFLMLGRVHKNKIPLEVPAYTEIDSANVYTAFSNYMSFSDEGRKILNNFRNRFREFDEKDAVTNQKIIDILFRFLYDPSGVITPLDKRLLYSHYPNSYPEYAREPLYLPTANHFDKLFEEYLLWDEFNLKSKRKLPFSETSTYEKLENSYQNLGVDNQIENILEGSADSDQMPKNSKERFELFLQAADALNLRESFSKAGFTDEQRDAVLGELQSYLNYFNGERVLQYINEKFFEYVPSENEATNIVHQMEISKGLKQKMTREEFIDLNKDAAIQMAKYSGIPASITLAQGILESNGGNSSLAREAYNLFGVKRHPFMKKRFGYGYVERHDDCCDGTSEGRKKCEAEGKIDKFVDYGSYEECLKHRLIMLTQVGGRYSILLDDTPPSGNGYPDDVKDDRVSRDNWDKAIEYRDDDDELKRAYGLKALGYATSKTYATKLLKIIKQYNLSMYDDLARGKGRGLSLLQNTQDDLHDLLAAETVFIRNIDETGHRLHTGSIGLPVCISTPKQNGPLEVYTEEGVLLSSIPDSSLNDMYSTFTITSDTVESEYALGEYPYVVGWQHNYYSCSSKNSQIVSPAKFGQVCG